MDEPRAITQSEESQKEKKTNIIYEHIYMDSRKMPQMNLFAGRNKDADVEKGHVNTVDGEGGMN